MDAGWILTARAGGKEDESEVPRESQCLEVEEEDSGNSEVEKQWDSESESPEEPAQKEEESGGLGRCINVIVSEFGFPY